MKTTEEIIELNIVWREAPLTTEDADVLKVHGDIAFLGGYRTAEAEYSEAIRELTKELENARDDVQSCLDYEVEQGPLKSNPINAYISQLARIDALLAKYKEVNHG